MKPHIFLDFDGLKFDTIPSMVSFINRTYKIESVIEDYTGSCPLELIVKKYDPSCRLSEDDVFLHFGNNFLTSIEWHKEVLPLDGMCEVVSRLASKYTIWTVTARQKCSLPAIEYLLDKYIPGCISGIHCVWDYVDGKYQSVDKREFISNVPGEKIAFFDDSKGEILKMQETIPSYLFDPSGLHDSDQSINNRIRSWWEIGEMLL